MKKDFNFVDRANSKHDRRYDYSLVDYKSMKEKVSIICNTHGIFKQEPLNHLNGAGCPKCGIESRSKKNTKSKEQFLSEAKIVHGDLYDYKNTAWVNSKTKINIRCRTHGEFIQSPSDHLHNKAGCPKCANTIRGNRLRHSLEYILSKAILTHKNKYDYSLLTFRNVDQRADIICPIHGVFSQVIWDHINGHGCKKCADDILKDTNKITLDEFILRARKVHGNFYDYSATAYNGSGNKIDIICPAHGVFNQTPSYHLRGAECPVCTISGRSAESKWLDFCGVPQTSRNRQVRIIIDNKLYKVDGFIPETNTVYEFYGDYWHGNPLVFEQNQMNTNNGKSFRDLYEITINRRNSIVSAGYHIIEIWESDWNSLKKTWED